LKQSKVSDINLLKPRKIGEVKQYSIQKTSHLISQIVNVLKDNHSLTVSSNDTEALIFIPNPSEFENSTIATISDTELPVRIILKVTGKILYVQIDEEYRSGMKYGNARKLIKAKYKNTFHYYLRKIESCIDSNEM
jgi:hypothetical protein